MPDTARRAGQSLAEFSLVIGLLLFIICGSCDAVQLALTTISVTEAASTAAHQATLIGGDDGPEGTVVQTARRACNRNHHPFRPGDRAGGLPDALPALPADHGHGGL